MTPRGIEILVKKASVDRAFRLHLLAERSSAAARIGLELDSAEAAMLDAIPEAQLLAIIEKTKVAPLLRPNFMGYAATAMLAAVGLAIEAGAETYEALLFDFDNPTIAGSGYFYHYVAPGVTPSDGVRPNTLRIKGEDGIPASQYTNDLIYERIELYWGQLDKIYEEVASTGDNGDDGDIIITFYVKSNGLVRSIEVVSNSTGSDKLADRIIEWVYCWRFPIIEENEVFVIHPFSFIEER